MPRRTTPSARHITKQTAGTMMALRGTLRLAQRMAPVARAPLGQTMAAPLARGYGRSHPSERVGWGAGSAGTHWCLARVASSAREWEYILTSSEGKDDCVGLITLNRPKGER